MKYGPRVLGQEEYERQRFLAEGGRAIYGSKVVGSKEPPAKDTEPTDYSEMKVVDLLPLIDATTAPAIAAVELEREQPRSTVLAKSLPHLEGEIAEAVADALGE